MGRPINKRFFGEPTAGGNEIKVDFHNGTAVVEGSIIKQLGSKKFRVQEIGASDTEYDRFLTTGKLASALTGTEMAITVKGSDSETYQVSKIAGRKATSLHQTELVQMHWTELQLHGTLMHLQVQVKYKLKRLVTMMPLVLTTTISLTHNN